VLSYSYDIVARSFDRYRALPYGVPEAVRESVLESITASRPRILDLGAGTGRIGRAFVAARDDYVAADLSFGMLREFARTAAARCSHVQLVQADGERLPFRDAAFHAVLLIQVMGAVRNWRQMIAEARRVLLPDGSLIVGQTVMPPTGIDARMKQRLLSILAEFGVPSYHHDVHRDAKLWLESISDSNAVIEAARWESRRSPRAFLVRQRTGARFSTLPDKLRTGALERLEAWASREFDSLDFDSVEPLTFELNVYKFGTAGR
jgi:ubiquinone/menaquinone biosynthesis C-methylase UbiE